MQLSFQSLLSETEESAGARIIRANEKWKSQIQDVSCIGEQTREQLIEAVVNVSNKNPSLFDQTDVEFELSSNFLLLGLKNNNHLLPLDERELHYLFLVSLIYGRYHFQLANPIKQALRHIRESYLKERTQCVFKSLFDKYNNPEFLSEHLLYLSELEINILMYLMRGGSLRKAPNLPFKISRKVSYRMLNIDFKLPLKTDIIYQQYLYSRLTRFDKGRTIPHSIVNRTFQFGVPADFISNTEYWDKLVSYLRKNVNEMELNVDYFVDYFYAQKENDGDSLFEKSIPSQLIDIVWWHSDNYSGFKYWEKFSWPIKNEIECGDQSYQFHQLENSEQLIDESSFMRNCARTFTNDCASGYTSIWSVTKKSGKKLMTLEINNQKEIVQMEGKANRTLTRFEKDLIEKWAQENGLKISIKTREH